MEKVSPTTVVKQSGWCWSIRPRTLLVLLPQFGSDLTGSYGRPIIHKFGSSITQPRTREMAGTTAKDAASYWLIVPVYRTLISILFSLEPLSLAAQLSPTKQLQLKP